MQVQGDNEAARDLGAVQRGDPEMEQKMNRVIRGCVEMSANPILAIHDQGAGGNGKREYIKFSCTLCVWYFQSFLFTE